MGNAIGWCDQTLNPVVGCWGPGGTEDKPNRCPWCYAVRQAPRVAAMVAAATGKPVCQDCRDFRPHLHPERLDQIGKGRGRRVFIGSMCDLWSDGVDPRWRHAIVYHIGQAQQNSYIMLTKQPDRMSRHDFVPADPGGEWPPNLWVGVSITDGAFSSTTLYTEFRLRIPAGRRVVSAEPLLGDVSLVLGTAPAWLIIGPQSGPGAKLPLRAWVDNLIRYADETGTPLWLKDGCYRLWPELPRRQEWPEGMVG